MGRRFRRIIKSLLPYGMVEGMRRRRAGSFFFEVHVAEHCNLNCKGCSHFSCVAGEEYLDPEAFDRDCERIAAITKNVSEIGLLGGEPLLHPALTRFFKIARNYFPRERTALRLTTNGILLARQSGEFWSGCAEYDVYVDISNYPIKLDLDKIKELAEKHRVKLRFNYNVRSAPGGDLKLMYKVPLDLEGKQNIAEAYANCPHPFCVTLRDGRIYRCCTAAHIRYFNASFGTNLLITEGDYMDLYKTKNASDLFAFLRGPFPFCRYCKSKSVIHDVPWAVTRKKIEEWV